MLVSTTPVWRNGVREGKGAVRKKKTAGSLGSLAPKCRHCLPVQGSDSDIKRLHGVQDTDSKTLRAEIVPPQSVRIFGFTVGN